VAEANKCVPHMMQVLDAARKAGIRVFYTLHHRYRPGDYETWKYIAPVQKAAWLHKALEYGTWGGEIGREFEPQPGEIVALEHWGSSGFANTDLDLQLKRHGIHKLIVMGLIAHSVHPCRACSAFIRSPFQPKEQPDANLIVFVNCPAA